MSRRSRQSCLFGRSGRSSLSRKPEGIWTAAPTRFASLCLGPVGCSTLVVSRVGGWSGLVLPDQPLRCAPALPAWAEIGPWPLAMISSARPWLPIREPLDGRGQGLAGLLMLTARRAFFVRQLGDRLRLASAFPCHWPRSDWGWLGEPPRTARPALNPPSVSGTPRTRMVRVATRGKPPWTIFSIVTGSAVSSAAASPSTRVHSTVTSSPADIPGR